MFLISRNDDEGDAARHHQLKSEPTKQDRPPAISGRVGQSPYRSSLTMFITIVPSFRTSLRKPPLLDAMI